MVAMLPIAGCAGPMGTIHTDTVPAPAATSFDGTYRSTIRVTKGVGQTSWCDTPGQPVITVANGEFSYATPHPNVPGNPTPSFPATFAPDGTFYGAIISGTISGQVRDTHMEAASAAGRVSTPSPASASENPSPSHWRHGSGFASAWVVPFDAQGAE